MAAPTREPNPQMTTRYIEEIARTTNEQNMYPARIAKKLGVPPASVNKAIREHTITQRMITLAKDKLGIDDTYVLTGMRSGSGLSATPQTAKEDDLITLLKQWNDDLRKDKEKCTQEISRAMQIIEELSTKIPSVR